MDNVEKLTGKPSDFPYICTPGIDPVFLCPDVKKSMFVCRFTGRCSEEKKHSKQLEMCN